MSVLPGIWIDVFSWCECTAGDLLHIAALIFSLDVNHNIADTSGPFVLTANMKVLRLVFLQHMQAFDDRVDLLKANAKFNAEPSIFPIFQLRVHACRFLHFYFVLPGPQRARPGLASVCSPSLITWMPLTKTCFTPVAYWCGLSKVA